MGQEEFQTNGRDEGKGKRRTVYYTMRKDKNSEVKLSTQLEYGNVYEY